jgi:hypothetical protein
MHFFPDFPHLKSNLVKTGVRNLYIMLLSICKFCEGKTYNTQRIKMGAQLSLPRQYNYPLELPEIMYLPEIYSNVSIRKISTFLAIM